jgi:hypothetical protein
MVASSQGYTAIPWHLLYTSQTFDHQIFTSQGSSLVKATKVDFASKRDTERFGTKDG